MVKKRLRWSLGITIITYLIWMLWDEFGDTSVWEPSGLQPFPGFVMIICIILDLWFWYRLRQEKRKEVQAANKTQNGNNIIDALIIFWMVCGIFTTIAGIFAYIQAAVM